MRKNLGAMYVVMNPLVVIFQLSLKENVKYSKKPLKKSFSLRGFSLWIYAILLVYLLSQLITGHNHSFDEKAYDLPIVILYDIEDSKILKRTNNIFSTEKESNHYNYAFNPLATNL